MARPLNAFAAKLSLARERRQSMLAGEKIELVNLIRVIPKKRSRCKPLRVHKPRLRPLETDESQSGQ